MRLPRRAPREVYRVYAEEEFLAGAEEGLLDGAAQEGVADRDQVDALMPRRPRADGGALRSIEGASGEAGRRLRRAAGAAMLLGAIGAFAVLLVVNGLLSAGVTTRRFAQAGLTATGQAAGSTGTSAGAPGAPGASHRLSSRAAASSARPGRSPQGGGPASTARRRGGRSSRGGSVSVQGRATAIATAAALSVARLTASAVAGSGSTGDPEFGFER
jgi:hypothetical protein